MSDANGLAQRCLAKCHEYERHPASEDQTIGVMACSAAFQMAQGGRYVDSEVNAIHRCADRLMELRAERDRARAEAEARKRGWFLDEEEGEDFPVPTWYAHNKGAGAVLQCTDVALVSHLASLEKP